VKELSSKLVPANPLGVYSDRARRCSDIINLHVTALGFGAFGKWAAIRLSDGGSDNVVYDSKADAVRHQLHETQCAYVQIPVGGMTAHHAEIFLEFNVKLYDAGMRLSDPLTFHMPQTSKLGEFR
jgi:hypothetical protein